MNKRNFISCVYDASKTHNIYQILSTQTFVAFLHGLLSKHSKKKCK